MYCNRCGASLTAEGILCPACAAAPPATAAPELRDAGFWLRFAAIFLDGLVVSAGSFLVLLALGALVALAAAARGSGERQAPAAVAIMALGYVLLLVAHWLYFALQEASPHQATVGKRALGLAVVREDGQRVGFGRATGRHFAKVLSAIPLDVGFVMAGLTRRKQALHDLVARTRVVRTRDAGAVPVVVAVVAGGFAMITLGGIVAAIAIPNYLRFQLRARAAEAPRALDALVRAEAASLASRQTYSPLAAPAALPGAVRREWTAEEREQATSLGWAVEGATFYAYRVDVAETDAGEPTWAACAEADLDGDGQVAAWVVWQPGHGSDGALVAPDAPCAFSPRLERSLAFGEGDAAGTPVRVSPEGVF